MFFKGLKNKQFILLMSRRGFSKSRPELKFFYVMNEDGTTFRKVRLPLKRLRKRVDLLERERKALMERVEDAFKPLDEILQKEWKDSTLSDEYSGLFDCAYTNLREIVMHKENIPIEVITSDEETKEEEPRDEQKPEEPEEGTT